MLAHPVKNRVKLRRHMEKREIDLICKPVDLCVNLTGLVSTLNALAATRMNADRSSGHPSTRVGLFLSLLFLFPASVRALDFTYTTNAGTITITGYTGAGGAVNIPDTIDGLPVGVIASQAFSGKFSLTSVIIPESVIIIGLGAFSSCSGLTEVIIGNNVATIGDGAFYRCVSLTSVTIPANVTAIGDFPFFNCTNLTGIEVDPDNPNYCSVDGILFDKTRTTLIQFPGGKFGDYTIPEGVTTIEYSAFDSCTNLRSVKMPDTLSTIGDFAFFSCSGLSSTKFGINVTSIGRFAFASCTSLTSVTIGKSVASVGDHGFFSCTDLTGVYFTGDAPTLGDSAVFSGTGSSVIYYLPGTTGWEATFASRPTVLWNPTPQITAPADPFGFTITGSSNLVIVVEAATSLSSPAWTPVSTNTLTDGSSSFKDPQWSSHPARFYRLRSP